MNVPDKWVSEGGFAVIDVSNDGHVTDILLFVHDLTDLVNCKVNHPGDLCPPLAENKIISWCSYDLKVSRI